MFKIHPRVSHTSLLLWRHFHTPKCDAEWNELWLVVWHVGQTASWAGFDQGMQSYIPDLQPSVWRSGYARLEVYENIRGDSQSDRNPPKGAALHRMWLNADWTIFLEAEQTLKSESKHNTDWMWKNKINPFLSRFGGASPNRLMEKPPLLGNNSHS